MIFPLGWQRLVDSGATAAEVDDDGRVIVPEDGLYLVYAQVRKYEII